MRNVVMGALALLLLVAAAQGADKRPVTAPSPPAAQDETAAPSSEEQADDRQCASYGAKPGTNVYVDCRLKLVDLRQQSSPESSTRPIRCRSIAFGGIIRTRCK